VGLANEWVQDTSSIVQVPLLPLWRDEDWAGGERERASKRERGKRETTGYEPFDH